MDPQGHTSCLQPRGRASQPPRVCACLLRPRYTEPCYAFIALANRLEHSLLLCLFRMQHDQARAAAPPARAALALPVARPSAVERGAHSSAPTSRAAWRPPVSQIALYWEVYDQLLQDSLPDLHRMFSDEGVTPHQYLMDWFFTVFSRE